MYFVAGNISCHTWFGQVVGDWSCTWHAAGVIHKDPYNCSLSKKLEKWAVRVSAEGSSPLTAGNSDPSLRSWSVITELLLHWREDDRLTEHSDSWLREVSRCCWEASWSQLSKIWPPSAFPKKHHDERHLSSSAPAQACRIFSKAHIPDAHDQNIFQLRFTFSDAKALFWAFVWWLVTCSVCWQLVLTLFWI